MSLDFSMKKKSILSENCVPFAFADFDADKIIEIYCAQGNKISIVKYDSTFRTGREVASTQISHNYLVTGMLAIDLDSDSMVDTIVFPSGIDSFFVYWGNNDNLSEYKEIPFKFKTWPIVTSIFVNSVELFGELRNGSLAFISFRHDRTYEMLKFPIANVQIDSLNTQAFIDLTGDLVPDLFLTLSDHRYQIWSIRIPEFNFTLNSTYDIMKSKSEFTHVFPSLFIDTDAKGLLNHIVPVCLNKDCSRADILIRRSGMWYSGLINNTLPDGCRFSTDNQYNKFWGFKSLQIFKSTDVDLDNYPDLLAICEAFDSKKTKRYAIVILHNTLDKDDIRKFSSTSNDLIWFDDPIAIATFFDIEENGYPDILVSSYKTAATSSGPFQLAVLMNLQSQGAYFFKVTSINGACRKRRCSLKSLPRGDNFVGSTSIMEILDKSGKAVKMMAAQSYQNSMFALQLPYVTFGLGDLASFVERFEVSINRRVIYPIGNDSSSPIDTIDSSSPTSNALQRTWNQMIPNSQIVVVPYPLDKPSSWHASLYINPSRLIFYIGILMTVLCILIMSVVISLQVKEKNEDDYLKKNWIDSN